MSTTIGRRIKEARDRADLNQAELGARIGVSKWTVLRYEKDHPEEGPGVKVLIRIAEVTGAPFAWLSGTEGDACQPDGTNGDDGPPTPIARVAGHDTEGHPHQSSEAIRDAIVFSAGKGSAAASETIVCTRSELETTTGLRADGLKPIFIEGDSLEPEVRANSWAWMRPMDRVDMPGIYAVTMAGHNIVKRFDPRAGGVLRVSGADPARYPAEEWEPIAADEKNDIKAYTYRSLTTERHAQLVVHGRVVAYTRVT